MSSLNRKNSGSKSSQKKATIPRNDHLPKLQFQTHYPAETERDREPRHVDGGVQTLVQDNNNPGDTRSSKFEIVQTRDGQEYNIGAGVPSD